MTHQNASRYLRLFDRSCRDNADALAFKNSAGESATYGEIDRAAHVIDQTLASLLDEGLIPEDRVLPVLGDKSPAMVAAFLACIRRGIGYAPLSAVMPDDRISAILEQLKSPVLLATAPVSDTVASAAERVIPLNWNDLVSAPLPPRPGSNGESKSGITGEDTHYIIFTSGSTGNPKGVEISAACVDNFLDWTTVLPLGDHPRVFLNQAPFSFDLSVYELATAFPHGDSIYALTKETQLNLSAIIEALSESDATVWVSTPSFANMCLSASAFGDELMPNLRTFLFCGEPLKVDTVRKLSERFPNARILNTYGPTESTVAVTSVEVDANAQLPHGLLSCGMPKPGTELVICEPGTDLAMPQGTQGEIVIVGNTVAKGYYRMPDKTEEAFFTRELSAEAKARAAAANVEATSPARAYHTGDLGFLDEDGMLYCLGRIDNQIKLNGYRIEIEDIEENLCKTASVDAAAVVPVRKDGSVSHLSAYVVPSERARSIHAEGKQPDEWTRGERLAFGKQVKEELGKLVPTYMIPRKIAPVVSLPMTQNGKIDRKKLAKDE